MTLSKSWNLALLGLIWVPAAAQSADISGYLTLTTDYVWRGVTQSDGDPAAQLGIDLNLDSGFYAGAWASTVDISGGPTRQRDTQVNYYAGYLAPVSRTWTLGAHVVAYTYPGADSDINYDYEEYSLSAGYDERIWFEFSYADDYYSTGETIRNMEIYLEQPVASAWTIGAGAGYYDSSGLNASGFGHWQVGVSRTVGVFDVDLRYHDTNRWVPIVSSRDRAGSRIALSVRWSF